MNWYEVLHSVQGRNGLIADLSTGDPLLIPEISRILADEARLIVADEDSGDIFSGYSDLDGYPDLLEHFVRWASRCFSTNVGYESVLITPGVQSALRYLQDMLRQDRRRALYPIGYEFPGAVDFHAERQPSVGRYEFASIDGCRTLPLLDLSSLDWEDVGAVFLSRPHSPTGRVWTCDDIKALATEAEKHQSWLVLDETYGLPFAPLAPNTLSPVDAPNVVHLYSFSKVGLAAERVGVAVGDPLVVGRLRGALRRSIIQSPKFGQRLASRLVRVFRSSPDIAGLFGHYYLDRWNYCYSTLGECGVIGEQMKMSCWEGGPFVWCHWSGPPTSDEVFVRLLDEGVAVAPASALIARLGAVADAEYPEGIRIGIGGSYDHLRAGVATIGRVLGRT